MQHGLDEGTGRWGLHSRSSLRGAALLDSIVPARGHHNDRGLARPHQAHLLARALLDEIVVVQSSDLVLETFVGIVDGLELRRHTRYPFALLEELACWFDRHRADQPQ